MKILALVEKNNGTSYWRVKIPLERIKSEEFQVDFYEMTNRYLPEDKVEGYDIIFYPWLLTNKVEEIALWKAKYGFKIIKDCDDWIEFSDNHPYYRDNGSRLYVYNQTFQQCLNADAITVSTKRLALNLFSTNSKLSILENYIPNDGQFELKDNQRGEKLKICLIGSPSHYSDYILMKGIINKICNNKKIVENSEFYVINYNHNYWNDIIKLFSVKKHINLTLVNSKEPDSYMSLLDNMDIRLLPLEYTEFNRCKSSVALGECMVKGVLPLGSRLYGDKELGSLVIAETPLEYEKSIEKLLDRDFFEETLKTVTENNLKDNHFEERIEKTKEVFRQVYNMSNKIDNLNLYSIVYDNNQIAEYEKYDNSWRNSLENKSYLFEHNAVIDILNTNKEGYFGVFSHKFIKKTGLSKNMLIKLLKEVEYEKYDVINLCKKYTLLEKDYLGWSYGYHKGLKELLEPLANDLGLLLIDSEVFKSDSLKESKVIYSNQFIAKKEVYLDYINTVLKPAIELMEGKYKDLAFKDAEYNTRTDRPQGLPPDELEKKTGLRYYPLITFALERLFTLYLYKNKVSIKSIF